MPELMLTSFSKNSSLSRTLARPGHNKNLLQANRDAISLLGLGQEPTSDLKGQVLRQLRCSQNLDPAVLATEACISLAQLYEIEKGVDSLFYSDTLRQQAARRVSQLLGIEWDLIDETDLGIQTATNVVSLQRGPVARSVANAVSAMPAVTLPATPTISAAPLALNSHLINEEASHTTPTTSATTVAHATFALGLSTPSVETESSETLEPVVDAPVVKASSRSGLMWLVGLLCVTGAAFFVAEQEGYVRQYWPDYYKLIGHLQLPF